MILFAVSCICDNLEILNNCDFTSKMVYTLGERVELILIYGAENQCARRTAVTFNVRHPEKTTSHRYVLDLVAKFTETGSVANKKRDQQRVLDEAAQVEVLGHFGINPNTSLRKVVDATGISLGSVHKVTKIHKYHPYKMQIHQELSEDDFDRRVEFCERMTAAINDNAIQVKNICFSDESTFYLNGFVNKHNCRYWSNENPHAFVEGHTQYPQKINVWAGILGNKVIGPLFLDGNLTGEIYLDMLQTTINPLIIEAIENQIDEDGNPVLNEAEVYFQQDGAPPHYVLPVRQWLDDEFPNKWIGRRGPMEWPARSPDLTPLDFFLWGHLKSIVFTPQPQTLEELRQRIIEKCNDIPQDVFENVRQEFEHRLYYCMANNGQHFEHLLKK